MKSQALDQAVHFILAFGLVALLLVFPGPAAGTLVGLALGLVREVTEGHPISSPGSLLDLAFWAVGGLTAGVAFNA